ncbi:MAG: hypothetical protein NHB32_05820 [Fischerella sp. CENA71]|nr:hypothetical protein [Fischerella sp. CENA71]
MRNQEQCEALQKYLFEQKVRFDIAHSAAEMEYICPTLSLFEVSDD